MHRRLIGIFAVLAVLLGGALGYGSWKNPERAQLDETARAAASGQFVALPSGITHYEISGPPAGRTVVLVHGFSVPYYIWDSTAVGLAQAGFRVLRYDLYGRGYSDRPSTTYDGALYVEQLGALLDALGITGPVDLMGLSFGGFVTARFVATHPSRLRTLTLVDPISERPELPRTLRLPVIGPWLWQLTVVPGMAEGQMTDFLHPENHPIWVDQYRPQMRYKGFGRALHSTMITASTVDFDSLYAGVARTGIPVLLIWGKQDRTVPVELSEVVRRNIPGVQYEPIDSAGHLPHLEQAAVVMSTMTAFLEAHGGPAR